ncbi:MAG: hypothetical protein IJ781_09285 [Atopobiaceae bacterium]|nr:hypothetical protein [Atopobiaceae bacterium]
MTVELAVLVPVAVVVGLTVWNLLRFVEACALFDRVALDAAISQGVVPSGEVSSLSAVGAVQSCIEAAMDSKSCTVEVTSRSLTGEERRREGISFPVSPLLTDFVCTLSYHPWPSSFVIAGVSYDSPLVLRHSRSIVVDRFRSGVVV